MEREDVQLAVRVGLDSMPIERRHVARVLLRSDGEPLKSADVELALGRSRPTARITMEALVALGAVGRKKDGQSRGICLLDSEQWLLDEKNGWVLDRLP